MLESFYCRSSPCCCRGGKVDVEVTLTHILEAILASFFLMILPPCYARNLIFFGMWEGVEREVLKSPCWCCGQRACTARSEGKHFCANNLSQQSLLLRFHVLMGRRGGGDVALTFLMPHKVSFKISFRSISLLVRGFSRTRKRKSEGG